MVFNTFSEVYLLWAYRWGDYILVHFHNNVPVFLNEDDTTLQYDTPDTDPHLHHDDSDSDAMDTDASSTLSYTTQADPMDEGDE